MALLVPDVGEVVLLSNLLAGGTLENWTLKLYKTSVTPAESDTAASYTVADFTSYSDKTLTRSVSGGTWSTPSTSTGTTSSSYNAGTPQNWTNTGASAQTIYGYYVVGATSTTLLFAELFAASRTLNQNDQLNLTPRIQLD
jgi:hypothetical protein